MTSKRSFALGHRTTFSRHRVSRGCWIPDALFIMAVRWDGAVTADGEAMR